MTQKQLIDVLTSVAPKIAETGDPEGVLLKAASDHNMYPAQLEKLGHAFNQMKTLVGLEKMASRGDSFKLLNVPAMVSKYTSYDPERELSSKDRSVHGKVDRLMKEANAWDEMFAAEASKVYAEPMAKSASVDKEAKLKKVERLSVIDEMRARGWDVEDVDDGAYTVEKEASAYTEEERLRNVVASANRAEEEASRIINSTRGELAHHIGKFASVLERKGPDMWREAVSDAVDRYGASCADAVRTCEDYFAENHIPFSTYQAKQASYVPVVAEDRHGVYPLLEKVAFHLELLAEARETVEAVSRERDAARDALEKLAAGAPGGPGANTPPMDPNKPKEDKKDKPKEDKPKPKPEKSLGLKDFTTPRVQMNLPSLADKAKGMQELFEPFIDDGKADKKLIQGAKDQAAKEVTLHRLIMSDPVITEADPEQVRSLYNSIASVSPTFAMDPNMMSAALKEALQYGALPVSMLGDIAKFEDSVQRARLDNNKLQDDYGPSGFSLSNEI